MRAAWGSFQSPRSAFKSHCRAQSHFFGAPDLEERSSKIYTGSQVRVALNHPNIMTVYEIDTVEDTAFIAMEFVSGETLRDKWKRIDSC